MSMTESESVGEAAYLKGLFPFTTDEQLDWWTLRFMRYEQKSVRRAIDLFAERYSDNVDRAGLLTLIEQQTRKAYTPRDPAAERAAADAHWAEVESTLAALTPEQRDKLRAVALAAMPPDASAFLAGRGDRPSRMLAAVMFRRLTEARAKRAGNGAAAHAGA